ncbi:FhaB protein [Actinobacillus pleuropneumoniae]|uniref:hypothetical protein n=1 Tax=Actinobacillus TaxID=713 RepID=UPI00130057D6|nr:MULTISPECIES: hypothetical protein [Actinobacillus]HDR1512669.1 hypothetical protein [Pasteurella multocida]MBL4536882.1 hypothetical protein [Actinobacillus pleuropneumoniae]MCI1070241.1 hypothetical protein [Actinobacillus pleuropneumoniae]MEE3683859.1 hypothetical protein [Actinobacillus pleuropneumoniae]QSZ39926.1 FhaB protein [Actinobacillus pleuropneumoniae]
MIKILQILVVNLPLVGCQNIYSEAAQLEAKQRLSTYKLPTARNKNPSLAKRQKKPCKA